MGGAREAVAVARGLQVASGVLAVPASAVAAGAAVGLAALAALAGVALGRGAGLVAWVLLTIAVAGLVAVGILVRRIVVTRRAARDPEALAADLLGLVDVKALTTTALADLHEATSRAGGVRAVSRARALWRLLSLLDLGEHTGRFERTRWFVPPEVATTWVSAQVVAWGGLLGWILVPVSVAVIL